MLVLPEVTRQVCWCWLLRVVAAAGVFGVGLESVCVLCSSVDGFLMVSGLVSYPLGGYFRVWVCVAR